MNDIIKDGNARSRETAIPTKVLSGITLNARPVKVKVKAEAEAKRKGTADQGNACALAWYM